MKQQKNILEKRIQLTAICANKFYQKLCKQYTRIERLRKQKKFLKKYNSKILCREIQNLNKLNILKNSTDSYSNQKIIVVFSSNNLFRELSSDF